MSTRIHPQARTTPKIRQEIKDSGLSDRQAAKVFNITRATAAKWLGREDTQDRSHCALTKKTALTLPQEALVVSLRETLYLPLDDLLHITKQYINPRVSRSSVARLLKRHGMSKLAGVIPKAEGDAESRKSHFKGDEPGSIHIDIKCLPQMADESSRRYLFVAIDSATRWMFLHVYVDMTEVSSVDFVRRLDLASPFKITKILTPKEKTPAGRHALDVACARIAAEHLLVPLQQPQRNSMVDRFNGSISELIRETHFTSAAEIEATLQKYLRVYNHRIRQRAIDDKTPIKSLKECQREKPNLFVKRVYDQTDLELVWNGCDPDVAVAIRSFMQMYSPKYTSRSKKFSIFRLIRENVDFAFSIYLHNCWKLSSPYYIGFSIYSEGKEFSDKIEFAKKRLDNFGFSDAMKHEMYGLEQLLQSYTRHSMVPTWGTAFLSTIDSVIALCDYCRRRIPKRSARIGDNPFPNDMPKTVRRRFNEDFPYCELCWRFCQEVDESNTRKLSSKRFCVEHAPKIHRIQIDSEEEDSKVKSCLSTNRLYRSDFNLKKKFHEKLREIYKEFPFQNKKWIDILGDVDETSIRHYAYDFVHVRCLNNPGNRSEANRLRNAGHKVAEIARMLGISRQTVYKITKTPSIRFRRTIDGEVVDMATSKKVEIAPKKPTIIRDMEVEELRKSSSNEFLTMAQILGGKF